MSKEFFHQRIDDGAEERIIYCNYSSDLKRSLIDILDADFGLLEKLSCVLTDRQYRSLRQYKSSERTEKLMEIVNLLPRDVFMKALHETGQQHIVNFIEYKESDEAGDVNETCWPLSEKQRNILRSSMHLLANMIDINSLLMILYSAHCITEIHFNYIRTEKMTYDCNLCFLEIMLKRSQSDYSSFINALIEIGQCHLACILSEGGGVVAVRAVLAEPLAEVEVTKKFRQWREGALHEDLQRMHELLGSDMNLVDLCVSCSVAVYIHCKTLCAFQHLDKMLKDGALKSVVGEIFSMVLDGHLIEVQEVDWYKPSYDTCLHFFYKGCYRKFHVCDPHNVTDVMERRQCCPAVKDLPTELLEVVLVKAIVVVFKHLIKLSTDAESLAIASVSMVCQHWRLVLETRHFIKQQIKKSLDHVCRPVRRRVGCCSKILLASKEDGSESRCHVCGVTTLDNKLFVVRNGSSAVSVFDLTSFNRIQNIELEGYLLNPRDIATCEVTRRIYIADFGDECVWCIDWSSSSSRAFAAVSDGTPPAVQFVVCENYAPWRLSFSGRWQQLLVTDLQGSLYVYDVDGKLSRRVELLTKVDDDGVEWDDTRHAVQGTTGDTYFVCRLGRYQGRQEHTHAEVAEYNSTGQRIRCFYCGPQGDEPQQVNLPVYISLICDGRLLVADTAARRVILLNTELKLQRVLLTGRHMKGIDDESSGSLPLNVCYHSQTGLLCVVMNHGGVNVY